MPGNSPHAVACSVKVGTFSSICRSWERAKLPSI